MMFRIPTFALAGVAALGMGLATPQQSQAQFGIHLDIGRSHFEFGRSRGHHYHHHSRHHGRHYDYHDRYHYSPRRSFYYDDHYYRRSPIVIPERYHWTPDRGFHSHGTILIPHRGHYHSHRY